MVNIATPRIIRIAETRLSDNEVGFGFNIDEFMDLDYASEEAEDLMEFAGRGCYQSFHKPNAATRANSDYLGNIIAQGHESVLEHATVTWYITGISRALTHELVRHRMFNFSQQSQRFVNEEDAAIILPPAIKPDSPEAQVLISSAENDLEIYRTLVDNIREEMDASGLDPRDARKQSREAARAALPNALETRITLTGNHRAIRNFLWRRLDPSADAEIRNLAQLMLDDLMTNYSAIYTDIKEHFSYGN